MIHLRTATPADAPIIHALAHRIWWAHYPDIVTNEQIEFMLERGYSEPALVQQMSEGQVFHLVFSDDQTAPVGYISLSPKSSGAYFIHKYYLDGAQQGKGLGAQAFQQLLLHYPDLQEVRLAVNRKNYKSINFYFKIGFIIDHCMDVAIGNGFYMNDFEMIWKKK